MSTADRPRDRPPRLQAIVGKNLRAYRESRGLSQETLAEKLGVHRTYLGGLERGEHNLTLRSLERIAERTGMSLAALLGFCERPSTRPS